MSRVDVVVPCYRYGRYLRQCVQSVLAQAGVEPRVLIIDDGSPDDTEAVGRELAAGSARVEYRRHPVNRGHVATFNEGLLDWAAGEYALLLSADDLLMPGALARATALMNTHPEVGMTYGRDVWLRPGDAVGAVDESRPLPSSGRDMLPAGVGPVPSGRALVLSSEAFFTLCSACCHNPVSAPTAVVRTRVQQAIGGYRADLPHTGDMEMWMRFAAHGPIGFVDARQAYYRWHGQNMQSAYVAAGSLRDLRQRLEAFRTAMRGCRYPAPLREAWAARAAGAIAEAALAHAQNAFHEGDLVFCEEALAYALTVSPGVRSAPGYRRLVWKRRLGRTTWSLLQPGYLQLRRLLAPGAATARKA